MHQTQQRLHRIQTDIDQALTLLQRLYIEVNELIEVEQQETVRVNRPFRTDKGYFDNKSRKRNNYP